MTLFFKLCRLIVVFKDISSGCYAYKEAVKFKNMITKRIRKIKIHKIRMLSDKILNYERIHHKII